MADTSKPHVAILFPGISWFGQEQATCILGKVIKEQGNDLLFLTHETLGREVVKRLDEEGVASTPLSMGTLWNGRVLLRQPKTLVSNLWSVLRSSVQFLRIHRRWKVDVLIMGNWTFALYILPALWCTRTKVIFRYGDEFPSHTVVHRFVSWCLLKRVSVHVANCQFLVESLKPLLPKKKPQVIYNTVVPHSTESQATAVPRPWLLRTKSTALANVSTTEVGYEKSSLESRDNSGRFSMLFVGQLVPHKGVLVLLEAFQILVDQGCDVELSLVGCVPGVGEYRDYGVIETLQRLEEEFPDRIRVHGFQKETSDYYHAADLHVCPSIWAEPSPNVVMEAKSTGTPTVGFDTGGMSELIEDGQDGLVCDTLSAECLAANIATLIDDPDRLGEMADAARASFSQKFGFQRYCDQWRGVISSALRK